MLNVCKLCVHQINQTESLSFCLIVWNRHLSENLQPDTKVRKFSITFFPVTGKSRLKNHVIFTFIVQEIATK